MTKSKRSRDRAPERPGPPARRDVLRFEVPYTAAAPRLINPGIGLASLVSDPDPGASYTIDVTLLDSPDHRLIRCGVMLAHRVREGMGDWYLSAEGWGPHLSGEQTEPMGQGDLPERYADVVRPFRRIGPLGPVAGMTDERRATVFLDVGGHPLATVRDDKVTIRRGGLTTARFREVTIRPGPVGLTEEQRAFLVETLELLGANQVLAYPPLVQRLGAPANGRSDYPAPRSLDDDATLSGWLANLIATRLRTMVEADLSIRQGDPTQVTGFVRAATRLRAELAGLGDLLDRDWREDIADDLEWLISTAEPEVPARLRSERYLTLLEQLVTAARGPQIGDLAGTQAKSALRELLTASVDRAVARAGSISTTAPNAEWLGLADALQQVLDVGAVAGHLNPKPVRRVRDRLLPLRDAIADCLGADLELLAATAETAPGRDAFELGRRYERELGDQAGIRRRWLDRWARRAPKLLG